jgi:hypothetical protein
LIRTIHEFGELYDVSPVTDPAYPSATSGVRATPDLNDLLVRAQALSDDDFAAFTAAIDQKRSLAQHDDGGKATQPVEQGASDAGLAPVETLRPGRHECRSTGQGASTAGASRQLTTAKPQGGCRVHGDPDRRAAP